MSNIDYIGAQQFKEYAVLIAETHGERFQLPASLVERIQTACIGSVF